jgi:DNA-directed RNA polymerase subunit alpha
MADPDAPIDVLQLSVRARNVLKRAGVGTVGQLAAMPNDDLLGLRNFGGLRQLEEVRARLALYRAGADPGSWAPDPDR